MGRRQAHTSRSEPMNYNHSRKLDLWVLDKNWMVLVHFPTKTKLAACFKTNIKAFGLSFHDCVHKSNALEWIWTKLSKIVTIRVHSPAWKPCVWSFESTQQDVVSLNSSITVFQVVSVLKTLTQDRPVKVNPLQLGKYPEVAYLF